jgi:hypothetical protein
MRAPDMRIREDRTRYFQARVSGLAHAFPFFS